jgi:hypothetical protein
MAAQNFTALHQVNPNAKKRQRISGAQSRNPCADYQHAMVRHPFALVQPRLCPIVKFISQP